jgi:hypothetical protein
MPDPHLNKKKRKKEVFQLELPQLQLYAQNQDQQQKYSTGLKDSDQFLQSGIPSSQQA